MKSNFKILSLLTIIIFSVPAFAQKYGTDSVKCIQNISLFREYVKQKNYKDATQGWRYVYKNCPASTEYVYIDGVTILKTLLQNEKDAKKQQLYIDTLLQIYDDRIKYFGKEGYVLGRKALDIVQLKKDNELAYQTFKKSVELEGKNSDAAVISTYFQVATILAANKKITKEEIIELYQTLSDITDYNVANNEKYKANYASAADNLSAMFAPFADCQTIIEIYKSKLESKINDIAWLKNSANILEKRNCINDNVYFKISEKLYELAPSAESAAKVAKMLDAQKQYTKAADFYEKAIEAETDNEKKAKYYYEAADTYFRGLKQYSKARTYAQKAASLKPNWGAPYIMIGDMYASTSGCGETACTQRAVYWAAVDKYQYAKSIDPSVATEANNRISRYSGLYPKKADCFFEGITDGSSYAVGCWIGENTTVRTQ